MISQNIPMILSLGVIALLAGFDFDNGRIMRGLILLAATAGLCYGIK